MERIIYGYNLEISDKTIEITKNILKNSNVNFKEKYLKNNIKVALIFSLRSIQTTIRDLELFKNDNLENEICFFTKKREKPKKYERKNVTFVKDFDY